MSRPQAGESVPPYCPRRGKRVANSVGRRTGRTATGGACWAEKGGRRGRWQRKGPGQTGAGLSAGRTALTTMAQSSATRGRPLRGRGQPWASDGKRTCPVASSRLPAAPGVPAGLKPARGRGASARCRRSGRRSAFAPRVGFFPDEACRSAAGFGRSPRLAAHGRTSVSRRIRLDDRVFFPLSRRRRVGERGGGSRKARSTSPATSQVESAFNLYTLILADTGRQEVDHNKAKIGKPLAARAAKQKLGRRRPEGGG